MRAALLLLVAAAVPACAEESRQEAIEEEMSALESSDPGRRRVAARSLARFGDEAVPRLAAAAGHPGGTLRREAAWTLAEIGTDGARAALEKFAGDVLWTVRAESARGIAPGPALELLARDPVWRVRAAAVARASPGILRTLFADRDRDVRAAAARAIVALGDRSFRSELGAFLADPALAAAGLDLFARIGTTEDLPAIRPLFASTDAELAVHALRAAAAAGCDVSADVDAWLAETESLAAAPEDPERERGAERVRALDGLGGIALVPAIGKRLALPGCTLRYHYALFLGRTSDPQAVKWLLPLVRDEAFETRLAAFDAVRRLDAGAARAEAPGLLKDPSSVVRQLAIVSLGATPDGRARLRTEIADTTPETVVFILRTLQAIAEPETDAVMETEAKSADPARRLEAVGYFMRHMRPAWLQGVEAVLAVEPSEDIRFVIVRGLASAPRIWRSALSAAAGDASPGVRSAAIAALAALQDPELAALFRDAARSKFPAVRAKAVDALDRVLGPAEVADFTGLLLDPHVAVREGAARALRRRPVQAAFGPLVLAAKDPQITVRWLILEALAAYPEDVAVPAFQALLKDEPEPLVRAQLARVSARFSSSVEFLVKQAPLEATTESRAAFVAAVAEAGGAGALPFLAKFAQDPDALVRAAAAEGMGMAPFAADVKLLGALARDADVEVRLAAVGALGQVPGEASAAALWRAVEDPSAAVRQDALAALARRGDRDAVVTWLDRAGDAEDERLGAAEILLFSEHPETALEILTARRPMSPTALSLAGWAALQLGLFDAAAGYFARADASGAPREEGADQAILARALAAARDGRPEAAALLEDAVSGDRADPLSLSNAAYVLADNLLLPELALSLAERAAAAQTRHEILDTLGWAQLRAGRAADALRTFEEMRPPLAIAWLHRACAESANGKPGPAALSLRRALSMDPALTPRAKANSLLAPLFSREELGAWK